MSHNGEDILEVIKKEWHGSYKHYAIGFFGSALLTALSFFFVIGGFIKGSALIYTITVLALIQAIIQVRYFLHVGEEPKPKWETGIFFFMVLVLLIVIVGTLWIMYDLNERVMSGM